MKDFSDIEKRLRNGKLPDSDMSRHRPRVWQGIWQAKKMQRKMISVFSIPPYLWAIGSLLILILFFVFMFVLRK